MSPPAVRLCRASEFSDFRIPENRWYTLDLILSGSGSWDRRRDLSSSGADVRGGVGGAWSHEHDRGSTFLSGAAEVGANRAVADRSQDYLNSYPPGSSIHNEDHREDRRAAERWTLGADIRRYWLPVPLAVGFHGSADVGYGQLWSAPRSVQVYTDSSSRRRSTYALSGNQWYYDHVLEGGASVGWGRVRNATGVFDAALLEKRLLKLGVIEHRFTRSTRRSLEALYYLRSGFGIAHDRPSRFFWRELERVLREDGSMTEAGWRAFDLFRADEGYVAPGAISPIVRRIGYSLGPTIVAQVRHQTLRYNASHERMEFRNDTLLYGGTNSYGGRSRSVGDQVLAGAEAEVHLPLGLNWQVDLSARGLSRPKEIPEAFDAQSQAAITWFVADRWGVNGAFGQTRRIEGASSKGRRARWSVLYGLSLGFYAEDRVTILLEIAETQSAVRSGSRRDYVRNGRVSLGMTYSFLGAFDAPGRIGPMRSLSLTGAERDW